MKVVFLAYEYPPCIFGGVGFFSKEFGEALSLDGVDLTVIAFGKRRELVVENVHRNLKIIRVPTIDFPPRHLWWQMRNHKLIVKLVEKISPDVIHANSIVASLPLQTLKNEISVPRIVTIHGDYKRISEIALKYARFMQPYDFFTYVASEPLHESLLRKDMLNVDCAVAVAEHVESDVRSRFASTRTASIYNGIDLESVSSYGNADELLCEKRSDSKIRIAFVGRLYWIKGVTYALDAFKHLERGFGLRNVDLHLYGVGPLMGHVLKFAKKFGRTSNRVLCHGMLDRVSLLRELRVSDIVVVPSLYEACPMALIEALVMGKPVVASDMPWSREFVEDGVNGVRTNTLDPEVFASSLAELIENQDARQNLSKNASESMQKYSISNTVSMYKDVYYSLA